jgi:hypothetical protein
MLLLPTVYQLCQEVLLMTIAQVTTAVKSSQYSHSLQ